MYYKQCKKHSSNNVIKYKKNSKKYKNHNIILVYSRVICYIMTSHLETIFNLFVYSILDLITEVGVVTHTHGGSDDEKVLFHHQNVC